MKKVFLGGTWNGSKWRDELIPMLKIDYSSPIETETAHSKEILSGEHERDADFVLHVITPRGGNFEALGIIARAVQVSNQSPRKAILCVLFKDGKIEFDEIGKETFHGIITMVQRNGSQVFESLADLAKYLNSHYVEIEYNPNVVECLIKRDGPTIFTLVRNKYTFEKNDAGHYVCLVMLKDHREYLIKLPDYRIYMKHLQPEPEFTDEEIDFMREWELKGADMFLAYVNGRITRFNTSRSKVRAIAVQKWGALLPKMECPIRQPEKIYTNGEVVFNDKDFGVVPIKTFKDEDEFVKEWLPLNANDFKEYVLTAGGQFQGRSEEILIKAKNKWDKLIFSKTGEPWPIGHVPG